MNNKIISYAQNREDIILSAFFDADEKGFYVDVGAEAPTDLSVTKIFYDRGWRGINIEPIKRQYELFVKERPKDINLNIGISNKNGELEFREYKEKGYSTFSAEMKTQYQKDAVEPLKEFNDYVVRVVTLKRVFDEHKIQEIQFLKIDVEGLEYEVLESNDWTKYRPQVICIEANHIQKSWSGLLKNNGYSKTFFDGLNEYYTDDKTDRASKFNYVNTMLFQGPIADYRLVEELERYRKNSEWLESIVNELKKENSNLKTESKTTIDHLHRELGTVSSLKKHFKKSLKAKVLGADSKITSALSGSVNYQPHLIDNTAKHSDAKSLIELAESIDGSDFLNYTTKTKDSVLLKPYLHSKKVPKHAVKILRNNRRGM